MLIYVLLDLSITSVPWVEVLYHYLSKITLYVPYSLENEQGKNT